MNQYSLQLNHHYQNYFFLSLLIINYLSLGLFIEILSKTFLSSKTLKSESILKYFSNSKKFSFSKDITLKYFYLINIQLF